MAKRSDVAREDGWFRFERKEFRIPCTDEDDVTPLTLTDLELEWRLLRERGSTVVYMEKTTDGGGITLDDSGSGENDVAVITIEPEYPDEDYDGVPAGTHYAELWDRGNDVLLSFGTYVLQDAGA